MVRSAASMNNVEDLEKHRRQNADTIPAPAHTLDSLAAGLHDLTNDVRRLARVVDRIAVALGVAE
jgi:hypothetical protein